LLEPETLAIPALNAIAVALPKAMAVPVLLVTVGSVPLGLAVAPEKVTLWEPV
jgi:hypothetical protein